MAEVFLPVLPFSLSVIIPPMLHTQSYRQDKLAKTATFERTNQLSFRYVGSISRHGRTATVFHIFQGISKSKVRLWSCKVVLRTRAKVRAPAVSADLCTREELVIGGKE